MADRQVRCLQQQRLQIKRGGKRQEWTACRPFPKEVGVHWLGLVTPDSFLLHLALSKQHRDREQEVSIKEQWIIRATIDLYSVLPSCQPFVLIISFVP